MTEEPQKIADKGHTGLNERLAGVRNLLSAVGHLDIKASFTSHTNYQLKD